MIQRLKNKHVLLGITGSIAAYKACIVLRMLQNAGAEVRVMMTDAARHFVGKWTFEALTQHEVAGDLFPENRVVKTEHVHLAEWADLLLICPATANCIGKTAAGIADDFLTTAIMASRAPVLLAPAMDAQMVQNKVFIRNCGILRDMGYHVLETGSGHLASGLTGPGRLENPEVIVDYVIKLLTPPSRLFSKRVCISAGPTREHIDDVRFISNASSGKTGAALAEEAFFRGADVTLVSGPVDIRTNPGIHVDSVLDTESMEMRIGHYWPDTDILVMTAAVSDFRPEDRIKGKTKKTGHENWPLKLVPTTDILKKLSGSRTRQLLVGFALESSDALDNARKKLKSKSLDLICLNEISDSHKPFASESNEITLIDRDENVEKLPMLPKEELAVRIWNKIETLMDDS
ncbi:bifunctional phosphopantothenoylcysteine decarboxylase/phosphopantothenate--cysteine ligase CoaBC [bacterium]|nr:bifunctional phosphopantothenoylcysteine decarboxylase/phosphopantothenate--cysteine ligase CoaBC [bacterium]